FFVFGAGTLYILRMMGKRPGEKLGLAKGPIRTAGITPAPQVADVIKPAE
ncbi:MAG: cytochrome ubiquinol oxidase subunit I, partial [Pseudomonadota bacterium]